LVAMMQPDLKRLIAYSSVSHLGFVMLGIFALNPEGIDGAIYQGPPVNDPVSFVSSVLAQRQPLSQPMKSFLFVMAWQLGCNPSLIPT